ncbi:MAG: hypothetical protein HUJ26_10180 [Planctomycetaceae bacterium]|nr:hypothetical protein [Planctomycetaceae bacterium]
MRKALIIIGFSFATINIALWFSKPAIRKIVDAHYGRPDASEHPMMMIQPGVQELLVYFDPWLARFVIPLIFTLGFVSISILLSKESSDTPQFSTPTSYRKSALIALCSLESFWLFLLWVEIWCRGPFWQFYWPSEKWDLIE